MIIMSVVLHHSEGSFPFWTQNFIIHRLVIFFIRWHCLLVRRYGHLHRWSVIWHLQIIWLMGFNFVIIDPYWWIIVLAILRNTSFICVTLIIIIEFLRWPISIRYSSKRIYQPSNMRCWPLFLFFTVDWNHH